MEGEPEKSCRTLKAKFGPFHINLNPVVTLISASVIWGFAIWAMVDTDNVSDYMAEGRRWITDKFTWLYIGTQDIWFIFILVVYFSKYGKMKLGRDDEEPEFSDAAYFTMLFSAGIAIGLFYFGVAEPIFHYEPGTPYGNRYWGRYIKLLYDQINCLYYKRSLKIIAVNYFFTSLNSCMRSSIR